MGLDTVIVAFFVIGTILALVATITIGTSNLLETSYDGYITAHKTTMNQLHTNIEITDVWTSNVTNRTYFKVTNTGETKLSNFDLWDIIIVNNEDSSVSYLGIDNDNLNIDFENDLINPGILDPHESIEIELPDEYDAEDHFLIKVITENGIASSEYA
jgi:flagellar protein FlaF